MLNHSQSLDIIGFDYTSKALTIITGTGRTGTSYLMALFTMLELPTGYDMSHPHMERFLKTGVSGFERHSNGAWISKGFINRTEAGNVSIVKIPVYDLNKNQFFFDMFKPGMHVIVPVRNLLDATNSRIQNTKRGIRDGGLHPHVSNKNDEYMYQVLISASMFVEFAQRDINYTSLWFPKYTKDPRYFYDKLRDFFESYSISFDQLRQCQQKLMNLTQHQHVAKVDAPLPSPLSPLPKKVVVDKKKSI